jgi:hypothetical protein
MRTLPILVAAAALFTANTCVQTQAHQIKLNKKHYQLRSSWSGHYDKTNSNWSDPTLSNSDHFGLINGACIGTGGWWHAEQLGWRQDR